MNRLQKIAIAAASLGGAVLMGAGVYAAVPNHTARVDSLVRAIAQKFNLNQSDVQQVFDQQRQLDQQQMQTQREQNQKMRLDQAVKDGKLTQAQEDLIIAKQKEVRDFMATLKDKAQADRQTAMKTEMDSVQQWAKDNSIPTQYMFGLGAGFGRGPMMGMGRGGHPGFGPKMGEGWKGNQAARQGSAQANQ